MTDSHVHFWDRSLRPYPWLEGFPAISGVHLPGDLGREAGEDIPARVVFVQADCARESAPDEAAWVGSLAGPVPVAGIVAFAPMDEGAATIRAIEALARRPLVKGIRHLIQGEADPGFCVRRAFVDGVRACGERGLSFDLCVRHHQLPSVVELARACPGTSLVLDHAGKPDLSRDDLGAWREAIRALADLPNTTCKLSGLATEAGGRSLGPGRFKAAADHLLATFGPSRILFGSDWPVMKLATTYRGWISTVRALVSHLPPDAQKAVFDGNAARVYRLDRAP